MIRNPRLWIGLVSATLVLSLALVDLEQTSPGPLTTVHGRVDELSGGGSCSACHGGWFESMTGSCLACHETIGLQMERADGLHGALGEDASRCARCHSEHHGAGFPIVNRQSFALAGSEDPESFDHDLVGFSMDGAHLELACSECHENADVEVLPEGAVRFLGLEQDCAACHEDPHEGRMAIACASCHGQSSFDSFESAGHGRYLDLRGGHAQVGCMECHAEETPTSLDALGSRATRARPRGCLACHDSPHDEAFLEGVAGVVGAGRAAGRSHCAACHVVADHEGFADAALALTPEEHAAAGFRLDPPHAEVSCEQCHAPEGPDFAARYPGRAPEACSACHEDPHGGQFAEGPFAGQECTACHETLRFEPHAFGAESHALAALPLDGSHLDAACEACHEVPAHGGPRTFRGTPARCELCHEDAHGGFFEPRLSGHEAMAAGTCALCHETESFSADSSSFDHELWTGFPIRGAHAQARCESCHRRSQEPDATGRTFGRVSDLFGEVSFPGRLQGPSGKARAGRPGERGGDRRGSGMGSSCQLCHVDPHDGMFDGPDLPARVDGRIGCARCHVETSFRALDDGFDHYLWTDFLLRGVHKEVGCSACHAPLARPDERGRTWAPAGGRLCSDCHADPHAGQFEAFGHTACQRCHTSDSTFSDLSFRHDRDSSFALGEAHAALECSVCHLPETIGGVESVRFKPLESDCVDCHGVDVDPLRGTRRRR